MTGHTVLWATTVGAFKGLRRAFLPILTMGKIRGTLHMRRYIFVLLATTKFLGKSFVFKNKVAREGLPRHDPSGLGAGNPRFKSGRPDQNISNQLLAIRDHQFTSNSTFDKAETGGHDL